MRPGAVVLAAALAITGVPAQPSARSPGNADYTIEVSLDPIARTLSGTQTLTWTNLRDRPAEEMWFHLYWNAWSNSRSTWMLENRLSDRTDREISEADAAWIDVTAVRSVAGEDRAPADLSRAMRFEAPDDGNPDDRTVLVLTLPEAVEPGESITLEMEWQSKIPRTFARTGFRGDYFFVAHWFPKVGVYEGPDWNCHQFHADTEFFSDYGEYDVRIRVPESFVVGATGRQVDRHLEGDGTATHHFRQADVHDFTWTASPDFVVQESRFEKPGLPAVDLRLLIQPEHLGQADRYLDAVRAALEHYGTWFGPYPYGHVTVVDPAWGSRSGGMEYPTLFTCGTRVLNPFGGDRPESVTIHETGHQFWYGIVGNNEFEHAWLDEGLNTFSTLRTLDAAYGPWKYVRRYVSPPGGGDGFFPLMFDDVVLSRWLERLNRYRRSASADTPSRPTYRYFPTASSDLSYSKTALWLATLERHLGWDTLQEILFTFFERHAYGHPDPEDFVAVATEIGGREIGSFLAQVHHGSESFDYAVDSVASAPAAVEGFVGEGKDRAWVGRGEDGEDGDDDRVYRTEVVVRRLGGAWFPVDILLVFDDGHEIRESWDGKARWTRLVVERPAKLDHAVVDPDRVLMLDLDYTNNSRLREPATTLPAAKWASRWMVWLQDLLATMEFFL